MKKGQLFSLLIGLTSLSAQADIVVYTTGTGTAGLMSDYTQTFTVRDASLLFTSPDEAFGSIGDVQATGENFFPPAGPTYAVLSLENLFSSDQGQLITSADDITSANLWVYQNVNSGGSGTLTIQGLSTTASDWTESTATWNTSGVTNGWDGAGGDIDTVLSGSYGTAAYSETNINSWVSINITDALKAYKEGTIGGIVLTSDGTHNDNLFSFDSDENISGNSIVLQVDQIPEPTAVSLIMIGGSFFYGVRRNRKNNEPEFK